MALTDLSSGARDKFQPGRHRLVVLHERVPPGIEGEVIVSPAADRPVVHGLPDLGMAEGQDGTGVQLWNQHRRIEPDAAGTQQPAQGWLGSTNQSPWRNW